MISFHVHGKQPSPVVFYIEIRGMRLLEIICAFHLCYMYEVTIVFSLASGQYTSMEIGMSMEDT